LRRGRRRNTTADAFACASAPRIAPHSRGVGLGDGNVSRSVLDRVARRVPDMEKVLFLLGGTLMGLFTIINGVLLIFWSKTVPDIPRHLVRGRFEEFVAGRCGQDSVQDLRSGPRGFRPAGPPGYVVCIDQLAGPAIPGWQRQSNRRSRSSDKQWSNSLDPLKELKSE